MRARSLPILTAVGLLGFAACSPADDADDPVATEEPSPDATGEPSPDATGEPSPGATEDEAAADEGGAGTDEGAAGEGGDADADGQDSEGATGAADLTFTTCEADDLTVEYPEDWVVHDEADVPPCRVFHPEPIEDFHGENLHYAVRLYIDPVEFEDATGADSPAEEISRESTTVDGRDAVVIEREHTGEALIPEGERSYTYTVDLDGMILVGTTMTVGDTDYERDKQILDRMMETVTVDVEE